MPNAITTAIEDRAAKTAVSWGVKSYLKNTPPWAKKLGIALSFLGALAIGVALNNPTVIPTHFIPYIGIATVALREACTAFGINPPIDKDGKIDTTVVDNALTSGLN